MAKIRIDKSDQNERGIEKIKEEIKSIDRDISSDDWKVTYRARYAGSLSFLVIPASLIAP